MEFSGERMMPEFNKGNEIYIEHLSRYIFASQFVSNKIVLDIACGSGYGSDYLLKSGAEIVVGVDISEESIAYCKDKYNKDNLSFIVGSAVKIPMEDNSVDIVVSFETIEHIGAEDQFIFMQEIKRVLKKDGVLLISTPNILVSPQGNPFHIKELKLDEFSKLLRDNFLENKLFFQENVEGSFILSEDVLMDDDISDVNSGDFYGGKIGSVNPDDSTYFVAVCSNDKIKSRGVISMSQNLSRNIHEELKRNYIQKYPNLNQENAEIVNIKKEIEFIKSSKFWKLRNFYIYLKNGIKFALFSPIKFIKKYFKI
ncbi:MAG: Glycosyltransferase, group 2 family protein [Candidatus Moranbacteria bacterium GW2011_GWA2_39_41]|nr:MAG: Glycosyltransferase, group 2 family protein [Candidatus Moranbacteria bacterium GW2011_GWA2_39_41]